jgi:hypothetical protein
MYAAELPRFDRRGLRPRRPKNGVATRAASTISMFLKNGKQGVQSVRLDELNNIATWANLRFISQT